MNLLFSQLENHGVLVSILIFILGIIGFFIKKKFFSKKHTNTVPYIKAGGHITVGGDITVGDKIVHNITSINKKKRT